jgi:hypothetical protein
LHYIVVCVIIASAYSNAKKDPAINFYILSAFFFGIFLTLLCGSEILEKFFKKTELFTVKNTIITNHTIFRVGGFVPDMIWFPIWHHLDFFLP